jgi:hypothetical protein
MFSRVLLGGAATVAALCVLLTLVGAACFLMAFTAAAMDEDRATGSEWGDRVYLSGLLAASCFAALRFGWAVARDWRRGGRATESAGRI